MSSQSGEVPLCWERTPAAPGAIWQLWPNEKWASPDATIGTRGCDATGAGLSQTQGLLAVLSPPRAKHPSSKALTLPLTLDLPEEDLSHQGRPPAQASWAQVVWVLGRD